MAELNDHKQRAHALLSASSAARWLACPPSAVAAAMYPSKDTIFTQEGTKAHEVAEAIASGKGVEVTADPEITTEMLRCAQEYADYIQEQITDPDATLLLEQRLNFSPWVPHGFGTGDCIILENSTLHIIDYKYGKGVEVSAVENPQMRLYALGAYNEFGEIYDVANIKTHIFQPRIHNISSEELTLDQLLKWGETIKPIAEKAAQGKGTHKAGDHCRFCPHAGACPTLAKFCGTVFDGAGGKVNVPGLAPFQVAEILSQEGIISAWLRAVKDRALADMLSGKEIPGYKVVEGKQGNRQWKDVDAVCSLLSGAGLTANEYTETVVLSPAKMDKAIGKDRVQELLTEQIERAPGAPAIAPSSDKRPPYDRLAAVKKDFE